MQFKTTLKPKAYIAGHRRLGSAKEHRHQCDGAAEGRQLHVGRERLELSLWQEARYGRAKVFGSGWSDQQMQTTVWRDVLGHLAFVPEEDGRFPKSDPHTDAVTA